MKLNTIIPTLIIGLIIVNYPLLNASPYSEEVKTDDLGAINALTKRHVKKAARLVRKGKVYSLALETNESTPAYQPREYKIEVTKTDTALGSNQATFIDDKVTTHNGIGTQIDGFAHAGNNFIHYNNVPVNDVFAEDGLKRFSTSEIPPIVTRAVLLNMADYFDTELVNEGISYNRKEIIGALRKQRLRLKEGDVVIFHSGWNQLLGEDNLRWISAHPGLGEEGARYLAEKGVVAVGADSPALEVLPFEDASKVFPVHQILLVENGVYIFEGLKTSELVRDGVDEFMFVLGIPKLAGSVQAIINPVAIH